jgi:hypothetical protein
VNANAQTAMESLADPATCPLERFPDVPIAGHRLSTGGMRQLPTGKRLRFVGQHAVGLQVGEWVGSGHHQSVIAW